MKPATKTIRERISELVAEAYGGHDLVVTPRYPQVLVKVLPRTTVSSGGIVLPEKQNKIMIEAVVLETYAPFTKFTEKTFDANAGERFKEKEHVTSMFRVGDHVLFRHHLGTPVPQLDAGTGEYRIVNENEIDGTLDYVGRQASERELIELLCTSTKSSEALLKKYHLIPKNLRPLTTSGA